ncbi:MAG: deoxyribose-phosphate aldolase [Ruminococcaceae bacterium]|nr:deoxyribose-phosphate aldolase [Oscillospiraceae bacterium]
MTNAEILARVDHTLLSQTATKDEIRALCDDALSFGTASVCIPPSYVRFASEYLNGRVKVCTVIGFPNGYNTAEVKVFEAARAVADGADEIDMVINIGLLKDGKTCEVAKEIAAVREATRGKILKVIVETCLLTEEEKIAMCRIVGEAGADYIKTSTGFSSGGATFEDVALFARHVKEPLRIKAAGGIKTLEDAEKFIALGADRLGTSRVVKIIKTEKEKENEVSDPAY